MVRALLSCCRRKSPALPLSVDLIPQRAARLRDPAAGEDREPDCPDVHRRRGPHGVQLVVVEHALSRILLAAGVLAGKTRGRIRLRPTGAHRKSEHPLEQHQQHVRRVLAVFELRLQQAIDVRSADVSHALRAKQRVDIAIEIAHDGTRVLVVALEHSECVLLPQAAHRPLVRRRVIERLARWQYLAPRAALCPGTFLSSGRGPCPRTFDG